MSRMVDYFGLISKHFEMHFEKPVPVSAIDMS